MNPVLAIAGAGTTFAATVVLGIAAGAWLDARAHTSYWVLAGFFAGVVTGAFAAWRLIARALRP